MKHEDVIIRPKDISAAEISKLMKTITVYLTGVNRNFVLKFKDLAECEKVFNEIDKNIP